MLSCKEVARQIASEEFAEARGWQRFQVRLHLLMCHHCRRYAAQLRAIGRAAQSLWGARPAHEDPDTLNRLAAAILKGVPREAAQSRSIAPVQGLTDSEADDTDKE